MSSEPPDRRQRKRRSTRAALATAAIELFEEQGFSATTIDDITDRADVARRTFFRHFASKEAVLFPDPEDYRDELVAALDSIDGPVTMSAILGAFSQVAATMQLDAETHRRRAAVIADNRLDVADGAVAAFLTARNTVIEHLDGDAATAGGDPASIDAVLELGVSLAIFAFAQAFVRWTEGGSREPLAEILASTLDLVRDLMADRIPMVERPDA